MASPYVFRSMSRCSSTNFSRNSAESIIRCTSGSDSENVLILPRSEYQRIKSAATISRREKLFKQQEERIEERKAAQKAQTEKLLSERREALKKAKEESEDRDAMKDREKQLENLKIVRLEQEDEVKKLNEMILDIKCLAKRENQIQEKEERKKDHTNNEKKLIAKLEQLQVELDVKRQETEEKKTSDRKKYAEQIKSQIEEKKMKDSAARQRQRESETVELDKKIRQHREQQLGEKLSKLEKQRKLQEGLKECLEEKTRLKDMQSERERKTMEIMKKQQMQRQLFEISVREDNERKKNQRLALSAHVAQIWERVLNDPSETLDDFKIRQAREQMDREWRTREVEKAQKVLKEKESLREFRENQVKQRQQMRRQLDETRKREHEKLIRDDNMALSNQKLLEEKKREEKMKYTSDIRNQILKNCEKNILSSKSVEEAHKNDRRTKEEYENTLRKYKEQKLRELRKSSLPEKYVKEVARRSKIPWEGIADAK